LNNEGNLVDVVLEYMKEAYNDKKFTFRSSDRGVVFFVRLYKLALSLGYGLNKHKSFNTEGYLTGSKTSVLRPFNVFVFKLDWWTTL
jgi:hypothetical protein